MKVFIDPELKDSVIEEWVRKVLNVVDGKLLDDLTVKIIEPTNKVDRFQLGLCTGPKEVEVYGRKATWKYYDVKRDVAETLFHEVCHANDPADQETIKKTIIEEAKKRIASGDAMYTLDGEICMLVYNHPREVRARAFAEKMMRQVKEKLAF